MLLYFPYLDDSRLVVDAFFICLVTVVFYLMTGVAQLYILLLCRSFNFMSFLIVTKPYNCKVHSVELFPPLNKAKGFPSHRQVFCSKGTAPDHGAAVGMFEQFLVQSEGIIVTHSACLKQLFFV